MFACASNEEASASDSALVKRSERMPRYAVPRYIEYVGELDKTPTGKLRKQDLRDAGITQDTWDRESIGYVVPR